MEILFLGTSSGTPSKTRNVTALALYMSGSRHWSLIDCGEGTQHQILHTRLSLYNLRAIYITHAHGDHCYGLPGLLASAGMLNRTDKLHLIAPETVRHFVEGALEATQLELPFPVEFIDVRVDGQEFDTLGDFNVQATALSHRIPSFAYSFTERSVEGRLDIHSLRRDGIPPGPAWSRIRRGEDVELPDGRLVRAADHLLPRRKPRKIVIGGDNDTPELLADAVRSADALVHEATYTQEALDKVGPEPRHSSAMKVAQFASEVRLKNLVLTHFSPRYHGRRNGEPTLSDIEVEARTFYEDNLFLASDFDHYSLDKDGVVKKRTWAPDPLENAAVRVPPT